MTPVEFRRHLHRHPELSFRETESARFIAEALREAGIPCRPIAGTGVLAKKSKDAANLRRAVVLRADIDALPIREQSGAAWSSENDGVMHACGHDIHAAVLYGTLLRLSAERNFEGTLFGIFQPGEESNPGGASKVLAENPFAGYTVLAVVGEHVEPALDAGTLGFRAGKYMASNDELRLTLEGAGGHAAMRAEHRDTVSAAAQLILHLTALNTPERVVSIGKGRKFWALRTSSRTGSIWRERCVPSTNGTGRSETQDRRTRRRERRLVRHTNPGTLHPRLPVRGQ